MLAPQTQQAFLRLPAPVPPPRSLSWRRLPSAPNPRWHQRAKAAWQRSQNRRLLRYYQHSSSLRPTLGTQLQIPREWHERRMRKVVTESLACAVLLGEPVTEQDVRKLLPSLRALSRAPTR